MATLRLYQVSVRRLASEPDSRGGTGWPGPQNDGYSRPPVPDARPSALRASVFGSESPSRTTRSESKGEFIPVN